MMTGGIADAFAFLLQTLATLFIAALIIRFALQLHRARFSNPAAQFLLRLTHPAVRPFRRVIPPVGSVDSAILVLVILLQLALVVALLALRGLPLDPALVGRLTLGALLHLIINIYIIAVLVMVIFSWISPGGYHPIAALLDDLTEPVLRPFRQLLPHAGGIDFSPMLAGILLVFLKKLLVGLGLPNI